MRARKESDTLGGHKYSTRTVGRGTTVADPCDLEVSFKMATTVSKKSGVVQTERIEINLISRGTIENRSSACGCCNRITVS